MEEKYLRWAPGAAMCKLMSLSTHFVASVMENLSKRPLLLLALNGRNLRNMSVYKEALLD